MDAQKKIRANSPVLGLVCSVLLGINMIFDLLDVFSIPDKSWVLLILCMVLILPETIWHCVHSVRETGDSTESHPEKPRIHKSALRTD